METRITAAFGLDKKDYTQYSPLTLAYIGDAVFDLVIRTILVSRHDMQTDKLHRMASGVVKAPVQAAMAEALLSQMSQEEEKIYRRGKNANPAHQAKNASRTDYQKATGLEALIGYLYLTDQEERLMALIRDGMEKLEIKL